MTHLRNISFSKANFKRIIILNEADSKYLFRVFLPTGVPISWNLLLCPRKHNIGKLQFIDVLKIIHDSVLVQLMQKSIHEDRV